ncbi:MAG: hypothetical protein EON58_20640 [Alphaproteobacteria bacterium]|nr:MAG: hypothetical protein EON58_20640 [Alphaproteobacteria bacterium]
MKQFKNLLPRTALLAVIATMIATGTPLLTAGCGGSTSQTTSMTSGMQAVKTGRAVFHITWSVANPANSRLIPQASECIEIRVLDGAKVLRTKILARPATEVTIEDLPAKKLTNVIRAFPNADASGVAQAEGRSEVEIKPDEKIAVSVTMTSTIDHLVASQGGDVEMDSNPIILISPRTIADEIVLIRPGSLRWTSSAPGIAAVDQNGVVTIGEIYGEAIITATELESNKSVQIPIEVGDAPE